MPAKRKPASKQPASKQPAGKKPASKKPASKKPASKQPASKQPASKQPAKRKPASRKPANKPAPAAPPAQRASATVATAVESYRGPDLQHHPVTATRMASVAAVGLRSDGEILQVEASAVAPCRLVDHGGGRYSLCFDDYAMPKVPLFQKLGLQGGGYTWDEVVRSLVKLRQPDLAGQLSYDSEAGMFVALGPRAALLAVARLIQAAIADPLLLRTAVERADPDALE